MSKEEENKKSKDESKDVDSSNTTNPQALKEDELDGVTGGRSTFADVPRVPSWDYNDEIKNKI